MSIESEIQELTAAVKALTAAITSGAPAAEKPAKKEKAAPAAVVVPEVVIAPPVVMPAAAPVAAAMPPPPSFIPPTPPVAVPASTVPFTDGPGLINYVMGAYKAMGPQKGAGIQGVLIGLGYQNINDVDAKHYAALYAGVEALK